MKTETPKAKTKAKAREVVVPGIAVSHGVAIGLVYDTTDPPAETPHRDIRAEAVEEEKQKLAAAGPVFTREAQIEVAASAGTAFRHVEIRLAPATLLRHRYPL